jgi:hypothetical protein
LNVFGGQSMSAMFVLTAATLLVMVGVKTRASTPNATPPNSAVPLRRQQHKQWEWRRQRQRCSVQ